MPWKVFADGLSIPEASRIDLDNSQGVLVWVLGDTTVVPVKIDHVVAVWENPESPR